MARFRRPGDAYSVQFYINGQKHEVYDKFPATTTLNEYIRDVAGLKGTKAMCKEAGCGCCAVAVTHPVNGGKLETMSINSCMCPLYSVDGWQITTTEGIGNSKDGFHPIQQQVAKHNATQCGYCTPGFVMSMYGLLHQNPKPSQQEIEDSLDGHICRCTGYRPILDAMKSFAADSNIQGSKCIDIEDLNKHLCPKTGEVCAGKGSGSGCESSDASLALDLRESRWYRPATLQELGTLVLENANRPTKMLFGNTASGIFKNEGPFEAFIDLHNVKELYQYQETANSVVFGANTTLSKLKDHLKELQQKPGFAYCERVVRHLKVLASVLVRNAGCIAGNLMIKHNHPEFPSDLFTMSEAIGASVGVYDPKTKKTSKHSMLEFLQQVKMKNKVLAFLELPKFGATHFYRSFKITPRWQNAHAYVNAAFKLDVKDLKVQNKPSLVFGGISKDTVHATKTEEFLTGKKLDSAVIKDALKTLASELVPAGEDPLIASPKYRKDLATNLLYKTLLEIVNPADPKVKSGAPSMERPLSSGIQTFQEKKSEFPLKEPLPKVEAPLQASGETVYTNDLPTFQNELCAAFVLTTIASGKLGKVDASEALAVPGVVRFLTAADIPEGGDNNFMRCSFAPQMKGEEVFVTSEIEYAGQCIGVILAETQTIADDAVSKVKVTYTDVKRPVLELSEAVDKKLFFEEKKEEKIIGDPDEAMKGAEVTVSGIVTEGTQYHFYLENQISVAVPSEDGIDLYAATQWAEQSQLIAAGIINKPFNFLNVIHHRLGGSFGGKFLYAANISAVATLACYLTKRPVRAYVNLPTNMKLSGKRFPILAKYKAGLSKDGKLKAIDADLYIDSGFRPSMLTDEFPHHIDQGYFCPNWRVKATLVKTNKATSQACRSPGNVPAALVIEAILEHAAKEINMHPILFKEMNLYEKDQSDILGNPLTHCTIKDVWRRLKQTAQVEDRMKEVDAFNKSNKWRKRGITMTAVKYGISYFPIGHVVNISVFAGDGTVNVITSGCEMGQGLYTKVAQAVAATLKIPLDHIKVRPGQNNVIPNPHPTGGSSGSEMCVSAAINAANELNERMRPIREKMPNLDWKSLLAACNFNSIDLSSRVKNDKPDKMFRYHTYCAGVVETEVDVLTGEFQVKRVDIMNDFGESINPTIDVGQTEGAYVMGLGAFLSEDIHYDDKTGQVLNDGTWEYKPPTTKDIPIDWRIHFLPDSPNPTGVLSSKAVGEPPCALSVGALFAIKSAVESLRQELTGKKEFLPVVAPYTVEKVQQDTSITLDHLTVA